MSDLEVARRSAFTITRLLMALPKPEDGEADIPQCRPDHLVGTATWGPSLDRLPNVEVAAAMRSMPPLRQVHTRQAGQADPGPDRAVSATPAWLRNRACQQLDFALARLNGKRTSLSTRC